MPSIFRDFIQSFQANVDVILLNMPRPLPPNYLKFSDHRLPVF
jgi:hypothetical protein